LLAWSLAQRALYLDRLVNNVRFLLLPWVKVPCLASVILSEGVRRLERDWPQRYGRPVWWVESFVDRQRFAAISYRAADWQVIGWTRGFAKRPEGFVQHGQKKEVYVSVREPRMRRLIHGDDQQPLLTRPFLLAQRRREEKQLAKSMRMKRILASWKPKLPPPCQPSVAELAMVGQELNAFSALFHEAFGRVEPTQWLEVHLQELLSQAEGNNLDPLRRRLVSPAQVRNFQRFLNDYRWDESWMAQRHWQLAAKALSDPQGVWSIDASPFPKQGQTFVGVAPQDGGALGQRVHGQLGIFIGYSSPKGHTLLESRLYLPQCWFEPQFAERRQQGRIPEETTFQTQPQLALELLGPLWKSQQFGGRWVACDGSFGSQDCYYLAEIAGTSQVWVKQADLSEKLKTQGCPVEHLLQLKPRLNWQTHLLSEKGPIRAAWTRVRVYLSAPPTVQSERWLLLRQDANGQTHYALSNVPEEIPLTQLVRVSRARWPVERCFQEGKSQLGLDQSEHRSWTAWHRHMRLAFLAQLFVRRLQIKWNKLTGVELAASTPGPSVGGLTDPATLFPHGLHREPP
jgi:SRSO17 transposase